MVFPPSVAPPSGRLREGHRRARFVGWAVYLLLAATVLQAVGTVRVLVLLRRLLAGGATADSYLFRLPPRATVAIRESVLVGIGLTGLMSLAAAVVLLVLLLRWAGWAREIAERSGAVQLRYGPVARVLCWIIPGWNVFGPKQVMNDLWAASEPRAPVPVRVPEASPAPWLLGWWLPLLASVGFGWVSNGLASWSTVGGLLAAQYLALVALALSAVSALVLVRIVRRISQRQSERAAHLGLLV